MTFDDLIRSDSQRALVRILRQVLPDDDEIGALLLAALDSAHADELPTEPDVLVSFVQSHLLAALRRQIGPHLAQATVNDLAAEIAPRAATSSLNIPTPLVSVPFVPPRTRPSRDDVVMHMPCAQLRRDPGSGRRRHGCGPSLRRRRSRAIAGKVASRSSFIPTSWRVPRSRVRSSTRAST